MKRPWQVWLLFAVCVLGALVGMAWVTKQALRADEHRRVAEATAELEQRVSLALWRMDTELAPIIAGEVIRPESAFRPMSGRPEEPPPYVRLQFEASGNGQWVSPQVANADAKGKSSAAPSQESSRLAELSAEVRVPRLIAMLPNATMPSAAEAEKNLAANAGALNPSTFGENSLNFVEGSRNLQIGEPLRSPSGRDAQPSNQQSAPNREADFRQRGQRYQNVAQQSLLNSAQVAVDREQFNRNLKKGEGVLLLGVGSPTTERVGVSRPVWVGDRLLLARRVSRGDETIVQGSWLDWDRLKAHLLNEVTDLSLDADLVPVGEDAAGDPSRMLAGLPARLAVGSKILTGAVSPSLAWALKLGWVAILLAVIAAALLLAGVMTLSERRAAFVSSVTHELRTPLTTFRMYSEMLAKGMVPDAARRQDYFDTLQREAERLTLLVENVLAYARLERGRRPQGRDRVTLDALLDRIGPRLRQRAAQAGMECLITPALPSGAGWGEGALPTDKAPSPGSPSERPLPEEEGSKAEFTTDQAVVEQILFNLVDNAAKYACKATDRRIHVDVERNGQFVKLMVRDHGPGIKNRLGWRRLEPFGKSAQESAESAPGIGLGLALCRRLARQLGGRLDIATMSESGASVILLLPIDPGATT